jgi:hypothetical protein
MSNKNCVILQSCSNDEFAYTRSVSSEDPYTEPFWTALIGTVVQITDPANFPDIYYTVVSVCFNDDPDPVANCLECMSATIIPPGGSFFSLPLEYVVPTNSEDCPVVDAYVLLNCLANPSVFTDGGPLDELVQSSNTVLVTSSDLALYVGSVVNLEEYPGNCYQVLGPYTTDTGCPCDYYVVTNAFKDCECCLPPVPEVFVRTTPKPFKNFTRITETECEIRTIEKFTVNYYNYFRELKYGLQACCGDHDLDKLWMDMQMVIYNRLKNGTCEPPAEDVVEECPVSPLA